MEPRQNAQVLPPGDLTGGDDLPDSHGIDGVGLLDEGVLAGFDGGQEINRMVFGRAGNEHNINTLDYAAISVQPEEAVSVIDFDLLRFLPLEQGSAVLDVVGEDISHGHQANAPIDIHGVDRRPRAAIAAADQADGYDIPAGSMDIAGQR
jgi:hypothetical protein